MQKIHEINELIKYIGKLPGLGPKSAKRIILKLINNKQEIMKPMLNSLANAFKNIVRCKSCGMLKSIETECLNCEKLVNKFTKICVVEDIADQWSIETSSIYQGYYHVLGGTISSYNNQNKSDNYFLIATLSQNNIVKIMLSFKSIIAISQPNWQYK